MQGELGEQLESGHLLVRNGLWSEYYKDGSIKSRGYYEANQPLGYWEYYHPNGAKKKTFQYAKVPWDGMEYWLLLGAYEEFYNNGQIKIIGKYTYRIDTVALEGVTGPDGEPEYQYVPVAKKSRQNGITTGQTVKYSKKKNIKRQ
jgi:MORN repeat variant.